MYNSRLVHCPAQPNAANTRVLHEAREHCRDVMGLLAEVVSSCRVENTQNLRDNPPASKLHQMTAEFLSVSNWAIDYLSVNTTKRNKSAGAICSNGIMKQKEEMEEQHLAALRCG